jgi:16S rRNA (cytidine1402-2'-O)-methyltransferase
VVILLEGRAQAELDEDMLRDSARTLRLGGATTREIVRELVDRHGAPRNLAYRLAQDA